MTIYYYFNFFYDVKIDDFIHMVYMYKNYNEQHEYD